MQCVLIFNNYVNFHFTFVFVDFALIYSRSNKEISSQALCSIKNINNKRRIL